MSCFYSSRKPEELQPDSSAVASLLEVLSVTSSEMSRSALSASGNDHEMHSLPTIMLAQKVAQVELTVHTKDIGELRVDFDVEGFEVECLAVFVSLASQWSRERGYGRTYRDDRLVFWIQVFCDESGNYVGTSVYSPADEFG